MYALLRVYLKALAKAIIFFKKPYIIGVTGSIWKTTVTKFVASYLESVKWREDIGYSEYNYNGEFWVPLTIIWWKSWGKNIFSWLSLILITIKRIFTKYPSIVVLEYGIDRPNEMDFLMSIVWPNIAIIGPIVPSHIENFWDFEGYFSEKMKIAMNTEHVMLHQSIIDNELFEKYRKQFTPTQDIVLYWKDWKVSDIVIRDIRENVDHMSAVVTYKQQDFPIRLNVFWGYQWENILPIFHIADILWIPLQSVPDTLLNVQVAPGRSRIIAGINKSIVIDGSYNWGYSAIVASMQSIQQYKSQYHILLFLGDMRELGAYEQQTHEALLGDIEQIFSPEDDIDIFLVGKSMKEYVFPQLNKSYSVRIYSDSRKAWKDILSSIESSTKTSIVFVKWSQNTIFLEEGIKEFIGQENYMLLPRQNTEWKEKKQKFFDSLAW